MTAFLDKLSSIVNASLDILLLKHPTRTSIGIVLGFALSFLTQLFGPILNNLWYVDMKNAPTFGWLSIGIIIAYFPLLQWNMFNKTSVNEEVNELILLIDKGNFSTIEKKQQYRLLVSKMSEHIFLNNETQRNMKKIKDKIINYNSES